MPTPRRSQDFEAEVRQAIEDRIGKIRDGSETILNLSGLPLESVPPEIRELKDLRVLHLGVTGLVHLPRWIGELQDLRSILLYGNQLSIIPDSLFEIRGLMDLSLSGNPIGQVPPGLGDLAELRTLNLDGTELAALPESVRKLKRLEYLTAGFTPMESLPDWLGELERLRCLVFNQSGKLVHRLYDRYVAWQEDPGPGFKGLSSLPDSLSDLQNLEALYLHGNDQLEIPPEILGPELERELRYFDARVPPTKILRYFKSIQRARNVGQLRPLNEAKVLVLGQPEAGKSSLIHALTEGWPTPDFPKTDGIARKGWRIPLPVDPKNGDADHPELRLNLWDFGGQEIYKATHTYFLTRRAIYVVVTTARKDTTIDEDLEEWLETAKTFGGGAPVWVVINKHDQSPTGGPDEVELTRKYYPMLRGFIRTQCQHAKSGENKGKGAGLGIQELRDKLISDAMGMPDVTQSMTTQALAIKRRLEEMGQPTLSMDEYGDLCRELGENNADFQATLLDLWDKLGTVRYFPDDENDGLAMKQTAILNPEWVTEAVYKILEDPHLKRANGLVTEHDLHRITKALKHPAGSHLLIADVLRRFSQLYDSGDGRMFIPQLLEDREPEIDWPDDPLRFTYQYTVLPAALIPSFIAKMHRFHSPLICPWRRGCVLELQGCEVRVIGDKRSRQIEISVSGGNGGWRRDALDQVRFKFEELHAAMTGLDNLKELIPVPGLPSAPMIDYRYLRGLEVARVTELLLPADSRGALVRVIIAEALGGVRGTAMKAREAQGKRSGNEVTVAVSLFNEINNNHSMKNNINTGNNSGVVGDGNTQNIHDSYNTISGVHGEDLAKLFERLNQELEPLRDEMRGKDYKVLEEHLATLAKEAEREKPDEGQLQVSGKGLIEAANTVKSIAAPVIATVGMILKFFGITAS